MYKYETHCHTALVSRCSRLFPQDIVELYVKNGYTGVFITDHFMNGNCLFNGYTSYSEAIESFCRGYEEVKKAAEGKLDVFFGLEFSYLGTDVLCYGWDKNRLLEFNEIDKMPMREFCDFCRENGALAVQAHPFREAGYIDHIRLYTNVEAIETLNTSRKEICNKLGTFYAETLNKRQLCGSDIHWAELPVLGGLGFEERLTDVDDFIKRFRNGEGKLFTQKNVCYNG